jgi:hypothetical protein
MSGGLYLPAIEDAGAPTAQTDVEAYRQKWLAAYLAAGSNVTWEAPQETLNSVATPASVQQMQACAAWAPARILYGRDRLGADLYDFGVLNGALVMFLVWGHGPWDGIESITLNDEPPPAGVTVRHYDGTQSSHDPTLAQLYGVAGNAERLAQMVYPYLVYSVAVVPPGVSPGMPQWAAIWRGRRLYDPRSGLTVWSNNASLARADYRGSAVYGMGRAIDWATVAACADNNDVLLAGEKRTRVNLTLATREPCEHWDTALGAYSECFVVDDGVTSTFVPDAPAAPVMDFVHVLGHIIELAPLEFTQPADAPNVVEIVWTDTSQIPWREEVATAIAEGVERGDVDVRLSRIAMPGIHDAGQAMRMAIQRLNRAELIDLATTMTAPARAAPLRAGDVIRVTHPCGLAEKAFRIQAVAGQMGDYKLSLIEYDAVAYSNAVVTHSTTPDTDLPDPAAPPAPIGLAVTEEVYELRDGSCSSRLRIVWDAAQWLSLDRYYVEVSEGGQVINTQAPLTAEARTPAVQEDRTYTVKVSTVARGGAQSAPAVQVITAQGNRLPPGPVPAGSFIGYEAGGTAYLRWGKAIDIGVVRYQLKRGTVAQTHAEAPIIEVVDALTYQDKLAPVGTWRYWIDSLDRLDQLLAHRGHSAWTS